MKLTQEQINEYAKEKELYINLPDKYLTDKALAERYHLERGSVSGDEDMSELFYNDDLRSHCGMWGEDWGRSYDIILFPKWYAQGWETEYFAQLLKDATEISVEEKVVRSA